MKNALDGLVGRWDVAKEGISKLEDVNGNFPN